MTMYQHNIDIALVCRKTIEKKGIGGWGYADPNANDLGFEIIIKLNIECGMMLMICNFKNFD